MGGGVQGDPALRQHPDRARGLQGEDEAGGLLSGPALHKNTMENFDVRDIVVIVLYCVCTLFLNFSPPAQTVSGDHFCHAFC